MGADKGQSEPAEPLADAVETRRLLGQAMHRIPAHSLLVIVLIGALVGVEHLKNRSESAAVYRPPPHHPHNSGAPPVLDLHVAHFLGALPTVPPPATPATPAIQRDPRFGVFQVANAGFLKRAEYCHLPRELLIRCAIDSRFFKVISSQLR